MKKIGVFVAGAIIIIGFWLPEINLLSNFFRTTQKGGKDHGYSKIC